MRKRKNFERREEYKSSRLVIIAAEGRYTENIYFNSMKNTLCATSVHVEILERHDDNSGPENVYNQIQDFKKEYNIADDDQLWIVIDKDRWTDKTLSLVAQYCTSDDKLYFCVSNPCFELWLLLHLEDVSEYSEDDKIKLKENKKPSQYKQTWLKSKLKKKMGSYSESKYDAEGLLENIDIAIQRAIKLDNNPHDRWPQDIGTRVYLLAQSIMNRNIT